MDLIRFPVSISQTLYLIVLTKVQEIMKIFLILRFGLFPAINLKLYQIYNKDMICYLIYNFWPLWIIKEMLFVLKSK